MIWLLVCHSVGSLTKITNISALSGLSTITNCLFESITTADSSGCLHVTTADATLTLSSCGFYNCTNSVGHVLFYVTSLKTFDLDNVCAYNCKTTGGQWQLYINKCKTNDVNQLSIVCSTSVSGGPLTEVNTKSSFNGINVSYNNVGTGGASGFCLGNTEPTCSMKYSNFFNTTGRDVLILDPNTYGVTITNVNIVECGGQGTVTHVLRLWGCYTLKNCIFKDNKFDMLSYGRRNGNLTMTNCWISSEHVDLLSSGGYKINLNINTMVGTTATYQIAGDHHVIGVCNIPSSKFTVVDRYNAYAIQVPNVFKVSTFLYCCVR